MGVVLGGSVGLGGLLTTFHGSGVGWGLRGSLDAKPTSMSPPKRPCSSRDISSGHLLGLCSAPVPAACWTRHRRRAARRCSRRHHTYDAITAANLFVPAGRAVERRSSGSAAECPAVVVCNAAGERRVAVMAGGRQRRAGLAWCVASHAACAAAGTATIDAHK
eukprot:356093-Chlamydomonas_euryale.AAC.3